MVFGLANLFARKAFRPSGRTSEINFSRHTKMSLLKASAGAGLQVGFEGFGQVGGGEGGIPIEGPGAKAVGMGRGSCIVLAKAAFEVSCTADVKPFRVLIGAKDVDVVHSQIIPLEIKIDPTFAGFILCS